jgi:hypothetical protein
MRAINPRTSTIRDFLPYSSDGEAVELVGLIGVIAGFGGKVGLHHY